MWYSIPVLAAWLITWAGNPRDAKEWMLTFFLALIVCNIFWHLFVMDRRS